MKQVKVFIIIPNWNGKKFLSDCLHSVLKITYPNYQIIVVDNGSMDGSAEIIKKDFPQAILIENKKNLGFAAGCNQGIVYAIKHGADYVLLLNNDTVVDTDFLGLMVQTAEGNKKIGIVGVKIYYFNSPQKIWFAGGDFIQWRTSGKHRYWQRQDTPELTGIEACDFVTGCAMLIKRNVCDDIGLLYEPYFLTIEDLDFCYRAQKYGWHMAINLDAHIWHNVSASRLGEFSFSIGYYGTRNRLFYAFKKTYNMVGGIIFLCMIIPLRLIQWTVMGRLSMAKGMIVGTIDFFRGKMGER